MGKVCPECGEKFDNDTNSCPYDGTELQTRNEGDDPFMGRVVDDRFRLDALLGEGGMGRVYEATQLSVDRQVAVKMIRTGGMQSDEIRQRFFREAKVISGFNHPNIVRLIDFGKDEELDVPYLAMEYIDGLELTKLLKNARLHPNLALEVASQIAAALVEAHDAEIVHRDLKTDNILLVPVSTGAFQVKVIDFGIAFPKQTKKSLTSTGMICGTPQYLSPEQARGAKVDNKSDLYSLGVIIYEMTAGVLPFQADSAFNIMVKHVQEDVPPLSQVIQPDRIPGELVALVEHLLEKEPQDRPTSGREIRRRIEEIRRNANWDPIRLDSTRPLREELEPWLLPKNADSASVALGETLGAGDVPNTPQSPQPQTGSQSAAPQTPSRAAPADQTTPPGQTPSNANTPAGQSGPVTDAIAMADGSSPASTPVSQDSLQEAPELGAYADSGTQIAGWEVKKLGLVAVALFVALGGLGFAAISLTSKSKAESKKGAKEEKKADKETDSEMAAEGSPSGIGDEKSPTKTESTNVNAPAKETDAPGESESADNESGSDDRESEQAAAAEDPAAKPTDDAPDESGTTASSDNDSEPAEDDQNEPDPTSADPPDERQQPDKPSKPAKQVQRQPPKPAERPSSGGGGSNDGSGSSDKVDEEYEESLDWLTEE